MSHASMSACSCCVRTERHMSRRLAWLCGEPFASGIGGSSPHGQVAHLPLAPLRELVETEDVGERLAAFLLDLDQLARHGGGIIP